MAGSSVSSMTLGGGSNGVKLDVVVRSSKDKGADRENSLNKIVKFRPIQLKNFSSNISKTATKRKEALEVRNKEQALVKKKINAVKDQNPFANKGLAESRLGTKINIST